ncbi:Obg-like ATPase 1 [Methanimicrococcus sp. At1]|uniref:Obg-like ATPase 1 n=1 Tax=Methanimicrococcus hacksteinii TaxID=3028293 RepID=A0ABU3VQZ3_9EURY|nr:redox-regulated ATPase YchF [Methanimicrococcus sp. At1]MDV0445829.1 Obg-like ATPase 1 [Methanimicrococcus sp. At1]
MSMTLGLAGKPNAGKSTFFKSVTMADVEIANYPFTTIHANHGVAYIQTPCPCTERETRCGKCKDGIRYVPIDIIDVAGLVPDAHKGKGLGNSFLDDLRQAQAIIHVVDASASTDAEGNPIDPGSGNPAADIEFLDYELEMWMFEILNRNWSKLSRKIRAEGLKTEEAVADQLSGAGVTIEHANYALHDTDLYSSDPAKWTEDEMIRLCRSIRKESKPMIIAANKFDALEGSGISLVEADDKTIIPTSAAAELALKSASKAGVIQYTPGDGGFEVAGEISPAQEKGLNAVKHLLDAHGSTGVQECVNRAVFELLDMIVVYPVEDEGKWTNKTGDMLPDAYLMKRGSTCKDLAYKIHSDIGDHFLYAVDARTKMRLAEKHELQNGDVIKIVSTAK